MYHNLEDILYFLHRVTVSWDSLKVLLKSIVVRIGVVTLLKRMNAAVAMDLDLLES